MFTSLTKWNGPQFRGRVTDYVFRGYEVLDSPGHEETKVHQQTKLNGSLLGLRSDNTIDAAVVCVMQMCHAWSVAGSTRAPIIEGR